MAGILPVVQAEQVGNFSRLHISFSVPARGVDFRTWPMRVPHPMVPIAVVGDPAFYQITRARTAVERCLQELQNIGCFVPDFSHFKILQMGTSQSTVVETVESLSRGPQDVVYIKNISFLFIS